MWVGGCPLRAEEEGMEEGTQDFEEGFYVIN